MVDPGRKLTQLVDGYFEGTIAFEVYRRERSRLLDSLPRADGGDTLRHGETRPRPQPPRREPVAPRGEPRAPHEPPPRADRLASARSPHARPGVWIAAVAVVAVGVVMAVVLLRPSDETGAPALQPASEPRATADSPAPAGSDIADDEVDDRVLVRDFLRAPVWQPTEIGDFAAAWQRMAASDRERLRRSLAFTDLAQVLRDQIASEQALAEIDPGGSAQDYIERLSALAAVLELPLPALDARTTSSPVDGALVASPEETSEAGPEVPLPIPPQDAPPGELPEASTAPGEPAAAQAAGVMPDDASAQAASHGAIAQVAGADTAGFPDALQEPGPAEETERPVGTPDPPQEPEPAVETERPAETPDEVALESPIPKQQVVTGQDNCGSGTSRRRYCQDVLSSGESGPLMQVLPPSEGTGQIAMAVWETSIGEYRIYCESTQVQCPDIPWTGNDMPVVNVSWSDAKAYADWLSRMTGLRYRLPRDSEWDFAARGGAATYTKLGEFAERTRIDISFMHDRDRPLSRVESASDNAKVVTLNAFRLYNMIANVREWTEDSADGGRKVVRGGSYADSVADLNGSRRDAVEGDSRDVLTGFRVVRDL